MHWVRYVLATYVGYAQPGSLPFCLSVAWVILRVTANARADGLKQSYAR